MTKPINRPPYKPGPKPTVPGGLTRLSVRLSQAQLAYLATIDASPTVALRVVVDRARTQPATGKERQAHELYGRG